MKFLQLRSKFSRHLSRLMALLRQQIFVYRCLWRFLDHPLEPPPPHLVPLPLFDHPPAESGQQPTSSGPQPQLDPPLSIALFPMLTAPVPHPIGSFGQHCYSAGQRPCSTLVRMSDEQNTKGRTVRCPNTFSRSRPLGG